MSGRGTQAVLLVAAGLVLAGCGLLGGSVSRGLTSSGCANIQSGGACQEQVDRVAARHPGATSVDLSCAVPVCDRKGGRGTAVVTMANGTTVNDTFVYTGDPAPVPVPSCTGMPLDACRHLAESQADSIPPSKRIVAIAVACTTAPCTSDAGDASVTVTLGDGTKQQGSTSWSGGPP